MSIENKLKKVISEIKKDKELHETYKTKISSAFFDECVKNQVDDDLPLELLHKIANVAADKLLNDLCV